MAVLEENSRALQKAGSIFQQPLSLLESAQTLAGIVLPLLASGKSGLRSFSSSVEKFARKPFQQGISDSHSLLKFPDFCSLALGHGEVRVQKGMVYPTECGQHLRRDPCKMGAPNPLF